MGRDATLEKQGGRAMGSGRTEAGTRGTAQRVGHGEVRASWGRDVCIREPCGRPWRWAEGGISAGKGNPSRSCDGEAPRRAGGTSSGRGREEERLGLGAAGFVSGRQSG